METRISKKCTEYTSAFKQEFKEKFIELGITDDRLLQFVFDYDSICLSPEDFVKRKRTKNVVELQDRCTAYIAGQQQCTRRRKADCHLCGTHAKGTPHGICDKDQKNPGTALEKVEVRTQNIRGIEYFIDNNGNVYKTEDVVQNKLNPTIIAKYELNGDVYSIPAFNITSR